MTLPLDNPAIYDLSGSTNADILVGCLIQDSTKTGIDLTGGSLSMQLRTAPGETATLTLSSASATANGSQLAITDATSGAFNIDIKLADLAALPFGTGTSLALHYDITFTNAAARTIRVAKGLFLVEQGVTV